LLLGDGAGRNRYRQKRECKEKFTHHRPSFWEWEIPIPGAGAGGRGSQRAANRSIKPPQALVNAAKLAAAIFSNAPAWMEPGGSRNRLILKPYL
jgi:hypothetical protein